MLELQVIAGTGVYVYTRGWLVLTHIIENAKMPKPKTDDDYRALAKRLGFTWLGPFPKNAHAKTGWLCARGHEIEADYGNLNQGMGCKFCVREDQGTRQRHPPSDYHALAYKCGLVWIGPEVKGAFEQTVWECCAYGHRWSGRYNDIQQGHGCKLCGARNAAEKSRRQPGEYYALAAYRGFMWLGPVVNQNKQKTHWRCMAGHPLFASFNQISKGRSCRKCSGLEPKVIQEFRDLALSRGFQWIGEKVCNTATITTWECAKGHTWPTTYSSIQQGSGCPYCAGLARKTADDYRVLAEVAGLIWLGPVPENSKSNTGWQCVKGHFFEKPFNEVQSGNGCLECSGLAPKTPEDYRNLASKLGFEWIGSEVPNTNTKTRWMCVKSHRWDATFQTIQQGHGCPECLDMVNGKRVSKNQRKVCEMVDGELNVPVGKRWVDVVKIIGNVKIAIEYDSWFYHGGNADKDRARDQELLTGGWRLLRIRSNKLLPTVNQINDAFRRLVAGEVAIDIVLDDWREGPVAWFFK